MRMVPPMNPNDPRNNCKMKERCECLARNASPGRTTLRMFCEQWQEPEKQIAAIHEQSIRNWQRLPDQVRVPCLDNLRSVVPGYLLETWRDQKARGVVIGSNRLRFHFDEGMRVRNILRVVHRDHFLPLGNWDDYYYGAIDELASTRPTSVPTVSRIPDAPCEFCGVEPGTLHKDDCAKLTAGEATVCHHHRATRECPICKRLTKAAERTIPPGVYYNREHANFYTFGGTGMGDAFYASWYEHRDQFPIRTSGPLA